MWLKKIKKQKKQFILVGIMLFVISMVAGMCACFVAELSAFSTKCISEENCPDVYIISVGSSDLLGEIREEKIYEKIEKCVTLSGKTVSAPIKYADEEISGYFQMMLSGENCTEWKDYFWFDDKSELKDGPAEGEVWITKTMSETNGLTVGDKIKLEYDDEIELKITKVFGSSLTPTTSTSFAPLIVSEEMLENPDIFEPDAAVFAVNFSTDEADNITELCDAYPFCATRLSRQDLRTSFSSKASVMGGVGIVSAVVLFLIALTTVSYIIKDSIMKQFKMLGIYKSLGYTSKDIIGFYSKGYLLVAAIAVLTGCLCGIPFTYYFGTLCTKYTEAFSLSAASVVAYLIVAAVLMLLVWYRLRRVLRVIKKITPVQAITAGEIEQNGQLKKSPVKHAKTAAYSAINDIFKYRKKTLQLILVLGFSFYLIMMFSSVYYSATVMTENANRWFAVPKCNVYLTGSMSDSLEERLRESDKVEKFVYGDIYSSARITSPDIDDVDFSTVALDIYSDTKEDVTEISMFQGESPKKDTEIAITFLLSQEVGVGKGENIKLNINDVEKEYYICGLYNSMMNAYGIMMSTETMQKIDPDYRGNKCFITLKNDSDFEGFKKEIESDFDAVAVDREWKAMENALGDVESMLTMISRTLIIVFIAFAMINIMIVLYMEIWGKRKYIGIMKSLGFTSKYIVLRNLTYIGIISFISALLAIILHVNITTTMLGLMIIDAFSNSAELYMGLSIVCYAVILIFTWLVSMQNKKITPVELMED